ncbi:tRNA-specific adenosine deaminase 1-like [Eurytemora carolleeae]|uniref:tRNA-specific adenosine deaminase 1-like n=1 Tax=Eurytemora carolleeae TaxID=1294199 RepID=UPI000C7938CB|nr:tRNA-specific adenosine deaminase 1-like [Eurytemora carolleeae]|eukprot:XP_023326597.1 tRNA-specific adenosine deaminase 1-like [Eurytemora affinis]
MIQNVSQCTAQNLPRNGSKNATQTGSQIMTQDAIANLCLTRFERLPKQGKPGSGQWTVLAGVVVEHEGGLELISLATGTKCLSGVERLGSVKGTQLSDSHAEVLARRGFLYWFLRQAELAFQNSSQFLVNSGTGTVHWKPGVKFHLYSSHPPCGDATIFIFEKEESCLAKDNLCTAKKDSCAGKEDTSTGKEDSFIGKKDSCTGKDISCTTKKDSSTSQEDSCTGKKVLCTCKENFCTGKKDSCSGKEDSNAIESQLTSLNSFKTTNSSLCSELSPTSSSSTNASKAGSDPKSIPPGQEATKLNTSKDQESHQNMNKISSPSLQQTNLEKDISEDLDEPVQKKLKLDTNRTGAKCVKGEIEDPLGSGTEYHNIGVLRRKPGRGDPTLSLSCSDKLLKWNVIGFQGSLVSQFLKIPVYFSTISIGPSGFNLPALQRALFSRYPDTASKPVLLQPTLKFRFAQCDDLKPSSDSILHVPGNSGFTEVYVAGYKQGWSKKKLATPGAWSSVSCIHLARLYRSIVSKYTGIQPPIQYSAIKQSAFTYNTAKLKFKSNLPAWPAKSAEFDDFSVE